jgi:hypothetical protein
MHAGHSTARNVVLVRVFVVALGSVAVIWGLVTLPIFWQQSGLERIAQSITRGETYPRDALAGVLPLVETTEKATLCDPAALRGAAVIRFRLAEIGQVANAKETSGTDIQAATDSVVKALACSPSDAFLWLALYWLKTAQHGFSPEDLKYLELSYQLGPNEGWIAAKRNAVTFAMLHQLPSEARAQLAAPSSPFLCDGGPCRPSDFSEIAINELAGLVRSGLYQEAAEVFAGPAWPERESILPRLASLPKADRRGFSDALVRLGHDVNVPGVADVNLPGVADVNVPGGAQKPVPNLPFTIP